MADLTDSEVSLSDDELELLTAGADDGGGSVAGNQPFLFGVTKWPGKPQTAAGLLAVQGVDQGLVQVCVLVVQQYCSV